MFERDLTLRLAEIRGGAANAAVPGIGLNALFVYDEESETREVVLGTVICVSEMILVEVVNLFHRTAKEWSGRRFFFACMSLYLFEGLARIVRGEVDPVINLFEFIELSLLKFTISGHRTLKE